MHKKLSPNYSIQIRVLECMMAKKPYRKPLQKPKQKNTGNNWLYISKPNIIKLNMPKSFKTKQKL